MFVAVATTPSLCSRWPCRCVPSESAYGDHGSPPLIGGGDVLTFAMEMTEILGDKIPAAATAAKTTKTKKNNNDTRGAATAVSKSNSNNAVSSLTTQKQQQQH